MTEISHQTDCPEISQLSEFADGVDSDGVASHVKACSMCSGMVAQFKRLDTVFGKHMQPPTDLSDKVKAAVSRAENERAIPFRPWWQSPTLRLAAAFALTAGALAVLVSSLGRTGNSGERMAMETQPELRRPAGNTAVAQSSAPRNVDKVAVQKSAGSGMVGGASAEMIAPRVRHVWSVSDVDSSIKHLKNHLPEESYSMDVENGNTRFQMTLKDNQLQKLVNDLADRRWQLVSDDAPQPHRASQLSNSNVNYVLILATQND